MFGVIPYETPLAPPTDEERRKAEAEAREREDQYRRHRAEIEAKRAAEYEALAAPIRAERLRRKALNFAKRQPKKATP